MRVTTNSVNMTCAHHESPSICSSVVRVSDWCTEGHGFDSRWGLRFFLCPTLATCWIFHLFLGILLKGIANEAKFVYPKGPVRLKLGPKKVQWPRMLSKKSLLYIVSLSLQTKLLKFFDIKLRTLRWICCLSTLKNVLPKLMEFTCCFWTIN